MSAQAKDDNRSEQQARAQLDSIVEMVNRLQHCREFNDCPGHLEDCELDRDTILGGVNVYSKQKITKKELAGYREQYHDMEEAEQRIQEDPLSVEVRSDWHTPGSSDADSKPAEFMILLCTGGPAVRIVGELSEYGEPTRSRIEHQDCSTPRQELVDISSDERVALNDYASCFYFRD